MILKNASAGQTEDGALLSSVRDTGISLGARSNFTL